jgi:hypothetical protein
LLEGLFLAAGGVKKIQGGQDGVVLQKDFGENTTDAAKAMTEFDPDDTWKPVE